MFKTKYKMFDQIKKLGHLDKKDKVYSSSGIAVVVQGKTSKEHTPAVIKSIKKYLPNAYIILSTWQGTEPINGVDIQINNPDPGANVLDPVNMQYNNLNRQIVSTLNGIKEALNREYTKVLKIRTDCNLTGVGFLNYFGKFKQRLAEYKVFKERVVICNKYVRPSAFFPFHISDWALFGLAEDLYNLFDIPLEPDEYANWFRFHDLVPEHSFHEFRHFRHRYCAEQYIWSNCLRKYFPINFEHMFDYSNGNILASDKSLINNFVVIPDDKFGLRYRKYKTCDDYCLSFEEWLYMYSKYTKTGTYHEYVSSNKAIQSARQKNKFRRFEVVQQEFKKTHPIKSIVRYTIASIRLELIHLFSKIVKIDLMPDKHRLLLWIIPITKWRKTDGIIPQLFTKKDALVQYIERNYLSFDRFVILELATGESTVLAASINKTLEADDRTVFIFFRDSSKEVFRTLTKGVYPTISASEIGLKRKNYPFQSFILGKDVRFCFPDGFWRNFWNSHDLFVNAIYEKFGIKTAELNMKNICSKKINLLKKKIQLHGGNYDNLVIISPEANSIECLPDIFWLRLIKKLKRSGFDVFISQTRKKIFSNDVIYFDITLDELLQLGYIAKHIYLLRSGLCEYLSTTGTPITIFYPEKPNGIVVKHLFHNYSMEQFITASPIKEEVVVENV